MVWVCIIAESSSCHMDLLFRVPSLLLLLLSVQNQPECPGTVGTRATLSNATCCCAEAKGSQGNSGAVGWHASSSEQGQGERGKRGCKLAR